MPNSISGPITRIGIAIAMVLISIPLLNLVVLLPPNFHSYVWRFGAVGILDNTVAVPIAGLGVLTILLLAAERRILLRALSLCAWASAFCLLGLLALFGLDAIQTRHDILKLVELGSQPPAAMRVFYLNVLKAVLQSLVAAIVLASIGATAWVGSRRGRSRGKVPAEGPSVLIGTAAAAVQHVEPDSLGGGNPGGRDGAPAGEPSHARQAGV
jgi:hypothetical protein